MFFFFFCLLSLYPVANHQESCWYTINQSINQSIELHNKLRMRERFSIRMYTPRWHSAIWLVSSTFIFEYRIIPLFLCQSNNASSLGQLFFPIWKRKWPSSNWRSGLYFDLCMISNMHELLLLSISYSIHELIEVEMRCSTPLSRHCFSASRISFFQLG